MSSPGINSRHLARIGVWLGLVAIALHALGPLLVPALNRAATASAAHAHDHATHGHHHGALDTTAKQAPPAPELVCVGDCPCCSLGERSPPVAPVARIMLVLTDAAASWRPATPTTPRVHRPGTHFPPRAPPASA